MTLTGVKTLPMIDQALVETGPWSALFARPGYRVYPYQIGCIARSASVGVTLLTTGLGEFALNDYLIVCTSTAYGDVNIYIPNTGKIAKVVSDPSLATDDTLTISPALSVNAGDYLLNLGADSGGVTPNYDGSRVVPLYLDNAGVSVSANKYAITGHNGEFRVWLPTGTLMCDLLIANSSNIPQVAIPFLTLGLEVI